MTQEEFMANELIGMQVRIANGHRVGRLADFVFVPGTCEVPLAIVFSGGIAGIGGKQRAVRFKSLVFRRSVPFVRLAIEGARWKKIREFDITAYLEDGLKRLLTEMPPDSPGSGSGGDLELGDERDDGKAGAGRERKDDGNGWRKTARKGNTEPRLVSDVLGMAATGMDDEEIGVVTDLVIDVAHGRIPWIVLSTGGFLGFGGEMRRVRASGMEIDSVFEQVRLPHAGREGVRR